LTNCTVSGNSADFESGGGIQVGVGTVSLVNTIVAGNEAAGARLQSLRAPVFCISLPFLSVFSVASGVKLFINSSFTKCTCSNLPFAGSGRGDRGRKGRRW